MVCMDHPKIIVCDCDGVLTDGKLNIDHTGTKMFKSFHTKDVRAIREFIANGYEFYIVSADDWGAKAFAEKVGAVFIELRDKKEYRHVLNISDQSGVIVIGDDAWDIPMMLGEFCYKPKGSTISPGKELNTPGGHGVIAELANILL